MKLDLLPIPGVVVELPKTGTLLIRGAASPELSSYLAGFIPQEEMADYVHPAYGEISIEVRMDPSLVKGLDALIGKRNIAIEGGEFLVTSFTGSQELGDDNIKSFVQIEVVAAKAVRRFDATEFPHTVARRVTTWSRSDRGGSVPAGTIDKAAAAKAALATLRAAID